MGENIKLTKPYQANAMALLSSKSVGGISTVEIHGANKSDLPALKAALTSIKHLLSKGALVLVVTDAPLVESDKIKAELGKASGANVQIGSLQKANPGYYLKMDYTTNVNVNKTKSADKAYNAMNDYLKG